jgi:hypothetical protein
MMTNDSDRAQILHRIEALQVEHRDVDSMIEWLSTQPRCDQLQIQRLKKRKLQLKDMISRLHMQTVPDVPA